MKRINLIFNNKKSFIKMIKLSKNRNKKFKLRDKNCYSSAMNGIFQNLMQDKSN